MCIPTHLRPQFSHRRRINYRDMISTLFAILQHTTKRIKTALLW